MSCRKTPAFHNQDVPSHRHSDPTKQHVWSISYRNNPHGGGLSEEKVAAVLCMDFALNVTTWNAWVFKWCVISCTLYIPSTGPATRCRSHKVGASSRQEKGTFGHFPSSRCCVLHQTGLATAAALSGPDTSAFSTPCSFLSKNFKKRGQLASNLLF